MSAVVSIPTYKLANGAEMPSVGCGTAVFADIGPNQTNNSTEFAETIVSSAVGSGARPLLIDCAAMYENEAAIGNTLEKLLSEGAISRDELFVSTKIAHPNVADHKACTYVEDATIDAYAATKADIAACRKRLKLDSIDLVIIHWPGVFHGKDQELGNRKRADIWRAMEDAMQEGLVKSIGVSNFNQRHLAALRKTWRVAPMVNQLEIHARCPQSELIDECRKEGMAIMAYCPLGSGGAGLMTNPTLLKIAERHKSNVGVILMSWHKKNGVVPIPKSTKPARIKSNLVTPAVELTEEDLAEISALAADPHRICFDPEVCA